MCLVGDFMDVFIVFKQIFENIFELLNRNISLGQGVNISLFGLFIGVAIFGLLISVVRKLYD